MNIYLYVKTHKQTGLKYLGKTTSKYPHTYPGSGVYWRNHLDKHGYDYTTEIIRECKTKKELAEWGLYYSKSGCLVPKSLNGTLIITASFDSMPLSFNHAHSRLDFIEAL